MISIILYGELGKLYGKYHKFSVKSAKEATRALAANFKGFRSSIVQDGYYKVIVDKKPINADDLGKTAVDSIKIIPLISGTGKGLGQIIVGAAIFVASGGMAAFGYAGFAGAAAGTGLWSIGASIGASLMLGGVSQMLTKTPTMGTASTPDSPATNPSYMFDGPVNTAAQGNPVPLAYGKILAGSQVISAVLETPFGGDWRIALWDSLSGGQRPV
jgi:predicted phage tail protein